MSIFVDICAVFCYISVDSLTDIFRMISNQEKNSQILIDLGLSENESLVYLAALSLGPCKVSDIARISGIKRTTVYFVIDSLKESGLMFIEHKGFKKLFVAEDPERLEKILEKKRSNLFSILPDLSTMHNLKGKSSSVKTYEGIEAVKSAYEDLLKEMKVHEEYLAVSDMKKWYGQDPDYFKNFIERRAKMNINVRLLLQDSDIARGQKSKEINYNEKIKILPFGTNLTTNLVITEDKALVHQLDEPVMAIVVSNRSVINMYKEFFEIMWKVLAE